MWFLVLQRGHWISISEWPVPPARPNSLLQDVHRTSFSAYPYVVSGLCISNCVPASPMFAASWFSAEIACSGVRCISIQCLQIHATNRNGCRSAKYTTEDITSRFDRVNVISPTIGLIRCPRQYSSHWLKSNFSPIAIIPSHRTMRTIYAHRLRILRPFLYSFRASRCQNDSRLSNWLWNGVPYAHGIWGNGATALGTAALRVLQRELAAPPGAGFCESGSSVSVPFVPSGKTFSPV